MNYVHIICMLKNSLTLKKLCKKTHDISKAKGQVTKWKKNIYNIKYLDQTTLHKDKVIPFTVSFFSPFQTAQSVLGTGLAPNEYCYDNVAAMATFSQGNHTVLSSNTVSYAKLSAEMA